jgi:hypothetical protein
LSSRRFRIRRDDRSRRVQAQVEAATHGEAANLASRQLYSRSFALRMSTWNGRDGVFAALDDRTGEERERFFVEAEDGTGKIRQMPTYPPSCTHEDAKKLVVRAVALTISNRKRKRNGKTKRKHGKRKK